MVKVILSLSRTLTTQMNTINIVLLEDDPIDRIKVEIMITQFTSNEYNFKLVNTFEKLELLVEFLETNTVDIIISDIFTKKRATGIELLKKIKARKATKPSVLIMSGFSDVMNEQIYHCGAEGKFTKPFNVATVREAIKTCLLAPEAKWARPFPDIKMMAIEKQGSSVASLEQEKVVLFGRGGFFIAHSYTPPEKGKSISFSIKINESTPVHFKGAGIIRWIQPSGKINTPPGLGVEITHLPTEQAKVYQQLFGSLAPFIPSVGRIFQSSAVA